MTDLPRDAEEQAWRIEQMVDDVIQKRLQQIHTYVQNQRLASNERRDLLKALGALLGGMAAMVGVILALTGYLHRSQPAQYPPGSTVTIQVPK